MCLFTPQLSLVLIAPTHGWMAEEYNRQAATSVKCVCTCFEWYVEIWSWSLTTDAHWASLAWRFRTSQVQARCTHVPMPTQPSSDRPLFTSFWRRLPPASALASSHQLSIPRYWLSTYGRRPFSVADPTVWNSLPEDLQDLECCADSYRQSLKTFLFLQYFCVQCIRGFYTNALYKFTFDIWHL